MAKTSAAANSFGSGFELIGKTHKGVKIVYATRKNITLEDGRIIPRAGNYVQFDDGADGLAERKAGLEAQGYRIEYQGRSMDHYHIYFNNKRVGGVCFESVKGACDFIDREPGLIQTLLQA